MNVQANGFGGHRGPVLFAELDDALQTHTLASDTVPLWGK